jgi:hypothetical protein
MSNGSVTESPTVTVPKSKLVGNAVILSAAAGVKAVKENSTAAEADSAPNRWFLIFYPPRAELKFTRPSEVMDIHLWI